MKTATTNRNTKTVNSQYRKASKEDKTMKTTRTYKTKVTALGNNRKEDKTMKSARVNEIMRGLTAFEKETYTRDEIISEYFKLQEEMATIAFGSSESEGKRFYDIARFYTEMNHTKNNIADEQISAIWKDSKLATNRIRAEVSGRKGENRTFNKLNYLLSNHRIRKNIEISDGLQKTEIDALVVTEKAAFIIEVKNTRRDIFIDENGQYYRTGEFLTWDSDLGAKLALREELVRRAAKKSGIDNIKVERIVVFTDNRHEVHNKCTSIRTCFLNQLTTVIDTYKAPKSMTDSEMDLLVAQMDSITSVTEYAPNFDVKQMKEDFADLVATLEVEEVKTNWWREAFKKVSEIFQGNAA